MENHFGFNGSISLSVEKDEYCESPREWGISVWYHWHKSMIISNAERISPMNREDFEEYLANKGVEWEEIFPLYMIDHGDVKVSISSFNCRFDSGQFGWAVIPKGSTDYVSCTPEDIVNDEVSNYNQYLSGEVFCYNVIYKGNVIESCGSFYEKDIALSEGMSVAEYHASFLDIAPRFSFACM